MTTYNLHRLIIRKWKLAISTREIFDFNRRSKNTAHLLGYISPFPVNTNDRCITRNDSWGKYEIIGTLSIVQIIFYVTSLINTYILVTQK